MKDIQSLLDKHPGFFQSMEWTGSSYAKPAKITALISQPRSGSTLVLRLMNLACLTHMVGDKPDTFYRALLDMYMCLGTGIYGNPVELEKNNVFPDEYRNSSIKREKYLFEMYCGLMLGDGAHCSGYFKTTILGWNNQMVEPFVEMLRDVYHADRSPNHRSYDLRIVFLTRNHDDIIKSFQTREGPGKQTAIEKPEVVRGLLEDQLKQFKQAKDLDDYLITYDDLINDPIKQLKKLNPIYTPDERMVKQVMSKILR